MGSPCDSYALPGLSRFISGTQDLTVWATLCPPSGPNHSVKESGRLWRDSFFCRFPERQEAKNRFSRKITNVAGASKVPLEIQNNSGRSKTLAGNSYRQRKIRRSS